MGAIISIDQSLTNCAWVLWEDCVMVDYGVIKTTNAQQDHQRIMTIVSEMAHIISENNIELMVLEGLSFGSISKSVRPLAGLYYALLINAELADIAWEELAPTSVKKFATGSGRAKKKDMWEALPENIKQKFEKTHKTITSGKHDLADAYHIGMLALTDLRKI